MTELAELALAVAIEEMDKEAGETGANNSGPFIEKYLNGLGEAPSNWCAALVCWCYKEAAKRLNVEMPFVYNLSARNLFNQFKNKNWLVDEPDESDIVFFWRDNPNSWMGHIGFVRCVKCMKNKRLITVEGNRGNFPAKVRCWDYSMPPPQLLGYGRII